MHLPEATTAPRARRFEQANLNCALNWRFAIFRAHPSEGIRNSAQSRKGREASQSLSDQALRASCVDSSLLG